MSNPSGYRCPQPYSYSTRQLQKYWDTPVTLTHALALTGVLGRKPPYPLKYPLARSSIPLPKISPEFSALHTVVHFSKSKMAKRGGPLQLIHMVY